MKNKILKSVICLSAAALSVAANAQTFNSYTFTTGLANVTGGSAGQNAALTDSSLTTGVANIGYNLTGDFGGGAYFHQSSADIILVGPEGGSPAWGSFDIGLQLSDGSYTPEISFSDANIISTSDSASFDLYFGPSTESTYTFTYCYLPLDISAFATGGLGVTGIEMTNPAGNLPDVSFIGVTGTAAVPEPTTLALAGLGFASLLIARRKQA